jgi:hypothetical protein
MTLRDRRPDIRFEGDGPARGRAVRSGRRLGCVAGYIRAMLLTTFGPLRAMSGLREIAYLLVYFLSGIHAVFAEQISRIKGLPCLSPRPAKRRGRRRFRPGPNLVQSSPARPAAGLVPGLRLATGGRGGWQGPARAACDAAGLGACPSKGNGTAAEATSTAGAARRYLVAPGLVQGSRACAR